MDPIVFISVDCLRADHLGCYGYESPTSPHIDDFADSATLYKHTYANSPGTRWAFQSLHTGLPTIQIDGLGIPEGYKSLASHFKENGYATGGFAVNGFVSREYGYDTGFDTFFSVADTSSRGTQLLEQAGKRVNEMLDSKMVRDRILMPVYDRLRSSKTDEQSQFQPDHSDADTVDQALQFVETHQNEPYFLWVHLMDAHTPYGHWPDHLEAIRGDADIDHTLHPGREGRVTVGDKPPTDVIDTYDAGIRSADEQIGRLLSAISDEATVVITGDHGEEFGRYREFHQASLYSSMTQVPLIVRGKNTPRGVSNMPVQHLDIPPTLLYEAGISIPDSWAGDPLQTTDRKEDFPIFFSLGNDRVGVRTGSWKYIESEADSKLFNTPHSESDSEISHNPDQKKAMKELVDEYRQSTTLGKGRSKLEEDDELNETVEENLEDLGYL